MPFMRRRPLLRAAAVGGTAYYAGKRVQENRDADAAQYAYDQQAAQAPPPSAGISPDAINELKQLAQLKDQGILTEEEFALQKAKLLQG